MTIKKALQGSQSINTFFFALETADKQPHTPFYISEVPSIARHNLKHFEVDHQRIMREKEQLDSNYIPDPNYLARHVAIRPGLRAQLIDWLMEVATNFYLHRQTTQVAVNYIDRFLSRTVGFPPNKLQLLGG